jgi:hypothetical protein
LSATKRCVQRHRDWLDDGDQLWLYLACGLVLPLASVLVMGTTCALNMKLQLSWRKTGQASTGGSVRYTLMPPVGRRMVKNPEDYNMTATTVS